MTSGQNHDNPGAAQPPDDPTTRVIEDWELASLYRRIAAEADNELTGLPFRAVLDRIAQRVTEQLPASKGASVILWDAESETFSTASSTVEGQTNDTPIERVRRSGGATRHIVDYQEPVVVPSVADDPFGANSMLDEFGVAAYVGVPILIQGESAGVLYALDAEPRVYTEPEILYLERQARRAAIEIANAGQLAEGHAAQERSEALGRITAALIEAADLPATLQVVVDTIAETLPASRVMLITIDERDRRVIDHIIGGSDASAIGYDSYDELMSGLTGWVLRTHQTVVSPKGEDDQRESADLRNRRRQTGGGSIVVVPLRFGLKILGTITAINRIDEADFLASDIELLEAMAAQAAVAIENARLAREVHGTEPDAPAAVARKLALALIDGGLDEAQANLADIVIWRVPGTSRLAGEHRGRSALAALVAELADEDRVTRSLVDVLVSERRAAVITSITDRESDWSSSEVLLCDIVEGRIGSIAMHVEDQAGFDRLYG